MRLVIYGDFNCPFSALASIRVARLEQAGIAEVDWRAVAHDPEIPVIGEPVGYANARAYEAEIEQVRGLLLDDETIKLRVPTVRASTEAATDAYAATEARARVARASRSPRPSDRAVPCVLGGRGEHRGPRLPRRHGPGVTRPSDRG